MKRPNIIFIVADDLGFADLGCYGGRRCRCRRCSTAWRRTACSFTQGYANSPVCSPTRFALMTARYQYRLRGAAEEPINSKSRGSTTLGLPPEHPTLPSLLQGRRLPHRADRQVAPGLPAVLRAAALGLRGVLRADVGRRRLLHATAIHAAPTTCGSAKKRSREEGYLTDLISRRAVDYIERMAGAATRRSSSACTTPRRTGPGKRATTRPWPQEVKDNLFHLHGGNIHTYRRMIHHMDEGIGWVMDALRRQRPGRRHAGGLHQRQRRRALLRQLAAGRRQDGPDRRRHPRALDRALAGRDRAPAASARSIA